MIRSLALLLVASLALPAQAAELVEDLNPGLSVFDPSVTPFSSFEAYTPVQAGVVFLGRLQEDAVLVDAPQCGLYVTDGTAEGTERLAELCGDAPNLDVAYARKVGANGSVALFADARKRIWRTDGTAAGTYPLGSVRIPDWEQAVVGPDGRTFFFNGCTDAKGCEPWKSDGSREGTALIRDLEPGRNDSAPRAFTPHRGRMLFLAGSLRTIWATDGTRAGTVELARAPEGAIEQILPHGRQVFFTTFGSDARVWVIGPRPGSPRLVQSRPSADWRHSGLRIEEAAGRVFIFRSSEAGPTTLWETNGTPGGTRQIGPASGYFGEMSRFFALGDRVVFAASVQEDVSLELWYLDPRMRSPRRLRGARPEHIHLLEIGNRLFFAGLDAQHGSELWTTDGTPAGTRLVEDLCPGICDGSPRGFQAALGHAFFKDAEGHLWASDGTAAGTVRLALLPLADSIATLDLATLRGRVVFTGFDDRNGPQPWVSDLTPAGTDALLPLGGITLAGSGRIWNLTPFGDRVLFSGCDGESSGIFVSDGTAAGTVLLPGTEGPLEGPCTIYHPFVRFTLLGDVAIFESQGKLWRTDGTPGGTSPLLTLETPVRGPADLGGEIVFALDPPDVNERVWSFWTSDGTEAGTRQAFDLRLGGTPFSFVSEAGEAFFIAQTAESPFPFTLWRTDGTEAGTRQLLALSYPTSGIPVETVRLGNRTILVLGSSERQFVELWETDGTAAGTRPVIADPAAPRPKDPVGLTVFRNAVWFFAGAGTPAEPFALWTSDGTAAGTRLVKTLALPPDSYGGFLPPLLTPVGDSLFFRADDGVHGSELWKTDGTPEGTVLVADIAPGAAHAYPSALAAFEGKLWFAATDGVHGLELWMSDGTAAGTRLADDVFPGFASSAPEQLTAVPGKLFFAANDGEHGRELWVQTGPR